MRHWLVILLMLATGALYFRTLRRVGANLLFNEGFEQGTFPSNGDLAQLPSGSQANIGARCSQRPA